MCRSYTFIIVLHDMKPWRIVKFIIEEREPIGMNHRSRPGLEYIQHLLED